MPTLLCLDTSTERLVLALQAGDVTAVRDEEGGARASAQMVPAAMAMLREAGIDVRALDAIAFGQGPGAFTGLRTACSVAQGLAFGAGRPVLPIDSLMIVAEDARQQLAGGAGFTLWVCNDARMDEIYAAAYRHDGTRWQVIAAPALYTLEALHARWASDGVPAIVAGSAIDAFGDRLATPGATRMATCAHRGEALLALARAAWADGEAVDAALALPLYLRDKVALTTAERMERAS